MLKSKRRYRFSGHQTHHRKIAIIGAVCRLPKSPDLESFWHNLAEGNDLISRDTDRWDMQAFYSEDKDAPGKTYTHHGGYLEDIAGFDAGYFNLNDEEAITLDPQHRIVLELAQELFDRAGFSKEELSNSRTSVFIGAKDNGYIRNGYHLIPENALQHTIVNNISNMIPARISDFYNLKGASKTIDTACSSSLVAVHDACESIIHDISDTAVTGGVYLIVDPFAHVGFSKAKVLSTDGKSYVFDKRAQGFVLGEGAGLVLLKDYDKALRDGDQILGTVLGSAVNNDGKTIGLTVPNQQAQKEVIEQALSKAEVNPESITYLEAHGTGTLLGDPIEIKAATEVYRNFTQDAGYCAVGSVKSNVGHTMTAAGVVGLIKILLAMKHRQIPATLHCESPHPRFEFDQSPFYPNTALKPWQPKEGVLRAAISSFGFGGTNCHLIVEESPQNHLVKRLPLPTTPFNRMHFWLGHPIEPATPATINQTAVGCRNGAKDIATEPRSVALLTRSYHANAPYVADHLVQGKRVLLGVTYCSLALEATAIIEQRENKPITGLKRLLFVEPVQLDANDTATITVHNDSTNQIQFFARNNGDASARLIVQGEFTRDSVTHRDPIDLEKLKKQATKTITGKALYAQEMTVVHGKSLHTVERIYDHSEYTLTRLKLAAKLLEEEHTYDHVHPALLDGAIVGGIASVLKDIGAPFIPFMIKEVYHYAKVSTPCYSLSKRMEKNREIIECDFSLMDESGQVCMELIGFVCKRLRNEKKKDAQASTRLIASPKNALVQSNIDSKELTIRIEGFLVNQLKSLLATEAASIPLDENFMDLGMDSIQLIRLAETFEKALGIELYPTLFFEHQTTKALADYFATEHQEAWQRYLGYKKQANVPEVPNVQSITDQPKRRKYLSPTFDFGVTPQLTTPSSRTTTEEPIAIIGMAGVFAQSPDLDHFWQHLYQQTDLIQEIPRDHFDYKPWFDIEQKADKMYCKWGAFIDHVDQFDADFFSISPKEAELMDPQLRYLLQILYHTAEDAGNITTIRGSHTGVYVGVCFHDYAEEMARMGKEIEAHDGSGNAATMLANRPSFYFNLTGPSLSVDTACSSSLFSVHLACKALQRGECDMAFAAGVNLLLSSWHYRYFCSLEALSPSGRCHTFDQRADGYVPGEGVGSVLLKPLNRALVEGDHIYGIVKGSAIGHGGYTPSITAPSVDGEMKVLLEAWKDAHINPETLGYIEAHGTGTKLGDPVEVNALKKAFQQFTDKQELCGLGSAKAHIGHAEGAAGIAGLIKVLLSLKHKTLPAMPKFEEMNPYIQLRNSPFYINEKPERWNSPSDSQGDPLPRRAGISSFGFGGAYAHVVVEEYKNQLPVAGFQLLETKVGADVPVGDKPVQVSEPGNKNPFLIVLSAKNEDRLREVAKNLYTYLTVNRESGLNLHEVAYTLQVGREAMEERLAFIVQSTEDLQEKLKGFMEGQENIEDLHCGQVKRNKEALAVFAVDDDMATIIDTWIGKGKYARLLDFWVKGVKFDWNKLYDEVKPRRISLPTYPFVKERYWLPESTNLQSQICNLKSALLHPLVHENTSTLVQQQFGTMLTGQEFFLNDHQILMDKVLPGVAYLEMARAAAKLAGLEQVDCIQDVIWASPIRVRDKPQRISIALYPEYNGVAFGITTGEDHVHSQGKVIAGKTSESPQPQDIKTIQERCQQSIEPEQLYATYRKLGLTYGPSFQGIKSLHYNSQEALAKIELPVQPGFEFNPAIIDSAIQAGLGLAIDELNDADHSPYVPFALKEARFFEALPEEVYSYVTHTADKINSGVSKYNITVLDNDGNVLVQLKELATRKIALTPTTIRSRAEVKTDVLYATSQWQGKSLNTGAPKTELKHLELPFATASMPKEIISTFKQAFNQVKAILIAKPRETQRLVWTVSETVPEYCYAPIVGLLKTARLENPKLLGKVIVMPELSSRSGIQPLFEQEAQDMTDVEVRYLSAEQRQDQAT